MASTCRSPGLSYVWHVACRVVVVADRWVWQMAGQGLVRRYWMPSSLIAGSGILTTYALAEVGKAGHHWWWVVVAAGFIGAVVGAIWSFRLQQSTSGPSAGTVSQQSAVQQSAKSTGGTYLSSDRGGVSAINIEGGVRTSQPPPDPEDTSKP